MSTMQSIKDEINRLVSANTTYNENKARWKYLLESYIGGASYTDGNHLTPYQLETSAEYTMRNRNTPLDNHCQSVVGVYNSFLFRTKPERDFGNLENLPELKEFMKDADKDGRGFNNFMKDVATWSSVFGHCWIVLTKPNLGATTRAEDIYLGARPYANLITPMAVMDWEFRRSPAGHYTLGYLKYLEDVNGDIQTIKEWTPDRITTTTLDPERNEIHERTEEDNQLGVIPAIIAYNKKSTMRGLGVSDLADISDAQRFIYNLQSELEETIRLDSHPSIVATPDTILGNGAGSVVQVPNDLDPGLKPYLLQYNGASATSILDSIAHQIDAIDKMANTGAVRAIESRKMSGVAMQTEFELLNARLSEKGDNLELAEENIFKLFALYMNTTFNGYIDYPDSFSIRDVSDEYSQLKSAREAAGDPRIQRVIDDRIVTLLDEDPKEILPISDFEPHIMYDAQGNAYMALTEALHMSMTEMGYTNEKPVA
tara:strand:+ start:532 stop:1986 length:1455 start_codon:yes stop_codon:yes gene_type:complete